MKADPTTSTMGDPLEHRGSGKPAWDADLPPDAVMRLSPKDKGMRTATSLTRKVQLLERWATEGIPEGRAEDVPWDRSKLRRWIDADMGLWPWADPQVDAKDGRHSALMERFWRCLENLRIRTKFKGTDLRAELLIRDRTIASLERQNAELIDRIRRLQTKVGIKDPVRR